MGWMVNIRIKARFAIAGLTRKRQCWVELTATPLEGQPISDTLFATISYRARTNSPPSWKRSRLTTGCKFWTNLADLGYISVPKSALNVP